MSRLELKMDSGIIDILITDKRGVMRPEIKSSLWFYTLTRNCQGYRSKYNAEMEKALAAKILEAEDGIVNIMGLVGVLPNPVVLGNVDSLVYSDSRQKWLRIIAICHGGFTPVVARKISGKLDTLVRVTCPELQTVYGYGYRTLSAPFNGLGRYARELRAIRLQKKSYVRNREIPFGIDYTYAMADTDASYRKHGRLWN